MLRATRGDQDDGALSELRTWLCAQLSSSRERQNAETPKDDETDDANCANGSRDSVNSCSVWKISGSGHWLEIGIIASATLRASRAG